MLNRGVCRHSLATTKEESVAISRLWFAPAFFVVILIFLSVGESTAVARNEDSPTPTTRVTGLLTVVWGDAFLDQSVGPAERYFLQCDSGATFELTLEQEIVIAAGGAERLNGRRVEAALTLRLGTGAKQTEGREAIVHSLRVLADASSAPSTKAITGPQPWISILCKFSDVSSEPKALSYFQWMYASTYPGLDHYWRTLSYNKANVSGSTAVAWVTLPFPVSHYASAGGGDINAMVIDCTAAADDSVYFPDFVGINMMFNDEFGPYAWGGSRYLNLDGVSKRYRVTWEPPWGYRNVSVIAHEMGHGFGLPHSNNADGDSDPYDNPWDVMSDTWHYAVSDSTYGTVGKGTIAYHLDMLGWIDAARRLVIDSPGIYHATVDHLTLSTSSNIRMIKVLKPGSSRFYTVEVRDKVGYDGGLPGFAVVVHDVDSGRSEDAWLVDAENPSNGADEGAMWRVGECFEDATNNISICVQSVATEGFAVRVAYGDTAMVFDDGFETGGFGAWSFASQ